MTPKEKAEDLIQKMIDTNDIISDFIYDSSAKLCAWIAVNEIEKALTDYGSGDSFQLQNMDSEFRYWEQVKNEIEKL